MLLIGLALVSSFWMSSMMYSMGDIPDKVPSQFIFFGLDTYVITTGFAIYMASKNLEVYRREKI